MKVGAFGSGMDHRSVRGVRGVGRSLGENNTIGKKWGGGGYSPSLFAAPVNKSINVNGCLGKSKGKIGTFQIPSSNQPTISVSPVGYSCHSIQLRNS